MKTRLISALLLIVGIIHLLPVTGVLGVGQLQQLYGVTIASSDLEILLRHRAVMFGIMGAFFVLAAFKSKYQPAAFVMAFVSIVSFLWLAYQVGSYQAAINKVVLADWVAGGCLFLAVLLYYSGAHKQPK